MNAKSAKILCAICLVAVTSGAQADESSPYEMVNNPSGSSYIQINQNLDSFSFDSDFHGIGNSAKVGYVVYPNDLQGDQLESYITAHADNPQFGKSINEGLVEIKELKSGDRVGFYFLKANEKIALSSSFVSEDGTDYVQFDTSETGGNGKIAMKNIKTVPSGAPLPGALVALLVGGAGIGALHLRKRRKQ